MDLTRRRLCYTGSPQMTSCTACHCVLETPCITGVTSMRRISSSPTPRLISCLQCSRLDFLWDERSKHGSLFTLPTGPHHKLVRRAVAPAFSTENLR
jgi:hypothetical protein